MLLWIKTFMSWGSVFALCSQLSAGSSLIQSLKTFTGHHAGLMSNNMAWYRGWPNMNSHTTTHTCTLMSASSCGICSLLVVNPTEHNARQHPLHSLGSSHSNKALFSWSGGLGVHISVIWLLCSAVLQLWWHLGVAPLFLTVLLPALLQPLVVSQDWGLCVSPHFLCTHAGPVMGL